MKRFKFRLDPVIRYRQYLEKMALMELAKAKAAVVQTKQRIRDLEQAKKDMAVDLRIQEGQGMSVRRFRVYEAYLHGLDDQIDVQTGRLPKLEQAVMQKYKAAEAQRVKKETLELAREKQHGKYMEQVALAEQKSVDELISLRRRLADFW